jgi:hypothetical protein
MGQSMSIKAGEPLIPLPIFILLSSEGFTDDGKMSKVQGVSSNGQFWIIYVLSVITDLRSDSKHASLLFDIDEDEDELLSKSLETLRSLDSVSSTGP